MGRRVNMKEILKDRKLRKAMIAGVIEFCAAHEGRDITRQEAFSIIESSTNLKFGGDMSLKSWQVKIAKLNEEKLKSIINSLEILSKWDEFATEHKDLVLVKALAENDFKARKKVDHTRALLQDLVSEAFQDGQAATDGDGEPFGDMNISDYSNIIDEITKCDKIPLIKEALAQITNHLMLPMSRIEFGSLRVAKDKLEEFLAC